MWILKVVILALATVSFAAAQDSPELAAAKALDQEIRKLKDLPDDARGRAVREMAARIRQQPAEYAAALAFNLGVDGIEGGERDVVQTVASTLADALRRSPKEYREDFQYEALAEMTHYEHAEVSLDDPRYAAAVRKLEEADRRRSALRFELADLAGKSWDLKSLNGKVVVVHFWATWCGPCRSEIPDLRAVYERFQKQGLVILAISGEESSIVRPFAAREKLSFPVLLDPGDKIREEFGAKGVPASFVYDRSGHLVATTLDRASKSRWMELLGAAGLQ